nr:MAG TPA: hypothetical protein [Caudoviricetes sp.]
MYNGVLGCSNLIFVENFGIVFIESEGDKNVGSNS